MLQWIKKQGISPIHLALLVGLLYACIHAFSWLFLCLLALVACCFYRYQGRKASVTLLSILVVFLALFSYRQHQWQEANRTAPSTLSQLRPLLDSIRVNGDRLSFRAESSGRTYQAFYTLQSEEEQVYFNQLSTSVVLDIEGTVEKAGGQRNFNGFDYQAYLFSQGIYRTVRISHIKQIKKGKPRTPVEWLALWRRQAIVYSQSRFPAPMNSYVTGLLFGHLDSEFDQMGEIYSSLGIIHLFALSGMQVGFFVGLFRWFFLRLGWTREQVGWLQFPFFFLYAGLTGFSLSVIRSLFQKALATYGLTKLDNLAVTWLLTCLFFPRGLLTAGGILSFAYAFLLTVFDFGELTGIRKTLAESLTLSVGILPFLLVYFYQFQPLSIVLTLVFSLVFDLLLLPGLSLVFLLSVGVDWSSLNVFFLWLEQLIRWLDGLGFDPWILGKPSLFLFLLTTGALMLLYDGWRKRRLRLFFLCLVVCFFFLIKHPLENEITVVDVGQGDSIFLRDSWGRTILIDVGGRVEFGGRAAWQRGSQSSNASRTLIPYLHSRGVGEIDCLVLTHTDTDHIGDLVEVAKAVRIKAIYVSPGSLTQPDFRATLEQLAIPVHPVQVGDRLSIADSYVEVLYPDHVGDGGNNDSIVLYGRLLQTNFLFTGDLEDGELDLMERYPHLPVDVLKAGHHGSKGSSHPDFLAHISPKIALVSAGKKNRYKHPHKETLDRFAEVGSTVYRTDQHGAIRFRGWSSWQLETVEAGDK